MRSRFIKIKKENKPAFCSYLSEKTNRLIAPDSIFDVHVKRMHEYKRQLLNVLKIVTLYNEILENPGGTYTPTTFIFGGKASPGYYMAKDIIKLIWSLGEEIENNSALRDLIRVIYLEDYNFC